MSALTKADLAEALECVWNAALGVSHQRQEGIAIASIIAESAHAMAARLRELDCAPQPALAVKGGGWTYSINYGPEGEENWANLIAPDGSHVANIRTHHAKAIVAGLSASPPPSGEVEALRIALLETADALASRLTAEERASATRLPYEHPLSVYDRAVAALESLSAQTGAEAVERGLIQWAYDTLYEINPSNYDHDDVSRLNDAAVEVILGLAQYLGERCGKTDAWWAEYRKTHPGPALSSAPATADGWRVVPVALNDEMVRQLERGEGEGYRAVWLDVLDAATMTGNRAIIENLKERK